MVEQQECGWPGLGRLGEGHDMEKLAQVAGHAQCSAVKMRSRPPAFRRVGWRDSDQTLWLWFSSGARYVYHAATHADFTGLQAAVKHGTTYNFNVRGQRDLATRQVTWPTDLDEEFNGGA